MFYEIKMNRTSIIPELLPCPDANFSTHFTRFVHYFIVF